jgi:hypothetical protein
LIKDNLRWYCKWYPLFIYSIYFHGNSDDIFTSVLFCQYLCENFEMNIIIVRFLFIKQKKAQK